MATELLTDLGKLLLNGTLLVGLLGFLGKHLLEILGRRTTDKYSANLERESQLHRASLDHEAEVFRLTLAREGQRWSRLDEKRAEVIAELYSRIAILEQKLEICVKSLERNETDRLDRLQAATDAGADAVQYFKTHEIFLPPPAATATREALKTLQSIHVRYYQYVRRPHGDSYGGDAEVSAYRQFEEQWPTAKEELMKAFWNILGRPEDYSAGDAVGDAPQSQP